MNVEQKLYNVEQIAQKALQLAKAKSKSGGREGVKPIVCVECNQEGHILPNCPNVCKVCYYLRYKNQKKKVVDNCNILYTEDKYTAEAKEVREAMANMASSSRGSRRFGRGRGGRSSSSSSGYNGFRSWYR
uniref:CCHC-type domain-containing protein n=1 Tax=Chromera velia CCMP2878 TaxID=1169474 RepID=A0A0G4HIJ8_9ALVE|eukprot:Cvel_27814.t1-p1 / transcript=Cvel_27814.t1 / gene=Cvel_27814 / organism=Chromera_velia_CCMP2878 / gene_product=hypothetical protein / transcript_product=hypothetical protein / location=Cvel_scaffold3532:7873-8262(-) / protein_length=130 / sequence_SO=supercontig / SO=protein_coding / is_pseudo=false